MTAPARSSIGERVRAFYEELPFNYHSSVDSAVEHIRQNPVPLSYPDLHALLSGGAVSTVLEFGCGAGWLSNALALHYDVKVTAVDFSARALGRAEAVADALGLRERVDFVHSNLFDFDAVQPVDLVISLGVLHHTGDAGAAFEHIQQFAGPGAHVYVGLYHLYGRREFLRVFRELFEQGGEPLAFRHYRQLDDARQGDPEHMRSWFRDQLLHPHETLHTLREVAQWCLRDRLEVISTSINGFQALVDLAALFELEKDYERRSHQANVIEQRYFPGFFVVMAQRQ